jgi:hypothetical protein
MAFLKIVRDTGCGCFFGLRYVGIFFYADDIVLLCPSLRGLRKMVAAASDYAQSLNLLFNPSKTVAVCFGTPCVEQYSLFLNGTNVKWAAEVKYLGIVLDCMLNDNAHYRKMLIDFYARCNAIFRTFRRFLPDVLMHLFDVHCCCFYGISCCSLLSKRALDLHVGWNKAVRPILRLPYRTHTALLPQIANKSHLKSIIHARFLTFAYNTFHSKNSIVRSIAISSIHNQCSLLGSNLYFVLSAHNLSVRDFVAASTVGARSIRRRICSVDITDHRVGFIKELLHRISTNHPDKDLFQELLEYLCCQ